MVHLIWNYIQMKMHVFDAYLLIILSSIFLSQKLMLPGDHFSFLYASALLWILKINFSQGFFLLILRFRCWLNHLDLLSHFVHSFTINRILLLFYFGMEKWELKEMTFLIEMTEESKIIISLSIYISFYIHLMKLYRRWISIRFLQLHLSQNQEKTCP